MTNSASSRSNSRLPHSAAPLGQARASIIPVPSPRLREFWTTPTGHGALSLIVRYFRATLDGTEHIPAHSGALIVSNHALFALDTVVFASLLVRDVARHPRFLADRELWRIPGLRAAISAVGALPGAPDAAQQLLRDGQLVIVYPGGVDDSLKLAHERYQLKWQTRAGFARVAMSARVPILPVVGFGIDDSYTVFAREHWLGRRIFGSPRYDLPLFYGAFGTLIPRRVPHRFEILPAIDTSGDPDNRAHVERVRKATFEALETRLKSERDRP
jgi:1-acyl-sn-glycerol-3-phosphate acyltransferase